MTSAVPWARGRLSDAADAPASGEVTDLVARVGTVVVEEIRSGAVGAPIDYCAEVDEWVVVLVGAATLTVDGETLELTAGDWVLLPARTPHTLVRTEPGTHWLTVTADAAGESADAVVTDGADLETLGGEAFGEHRERTGS